MCPGVPTTPSTVPASASRSPGASTRPRGPATSARRGGDRRAEALPPGQGRLGVVTVVVGDEDGDAAGVPGGQRGLDRGEVRGVVRARVDEHRLPAARLPHQIGVGAVEGHPGRVRRQHPRDQRLQLRRARHRPEGGQVPAGARVGRDVHGRNGSRITPTSSDWPLASRAMRLTGNFARTAVTGAAAAGPAHRLLGRRLEQRVQLVLGYDHLVVGRDDVRRPHGRRRRVLRGGSAADR